MDADFVVTSGILVSILVASHYIRAGLTNTLPADSLVLGLLLEAVATFEFCAVAFEQGLLYEFYGLTTFHIALFFIILWRFYSWHNVSTAPYVHFERWMDGKVAVGPALMYVGAEFVAGALVYQYFTKPIWSLDLSTHHTAKLHNFAVTPCHTAVQVNYLAGALIEGACVFAIELSFYYLSLLQNVAVHILNAGRAAIITLLVFAAFFTTGGFMAPVLATVLQWGCGGITAWQHFIVYWVGPSLASLAAQYLIKTIAGPAPGSSGAAAGGNARKDS